MFKVGQRVHNNKESYFCEILDNMDDIYYKVKIEGSLDTRWFRIRILHETADDMFEALGYKIVSSRDEEVIISYRFIANIYPFRLPKQ